MPWFEDEATATAKGERRAVLVMASIFALLTAAHLTMAFIYMHPENPFLCSLPRMALALLWLMLAGLAVYATRRGQFAENQRFLAIAAIVAALIGAYVGLRADNDMFTLAVRY